MTLEARIDGAAAFKKVAANMREQGRQDLAKEMGVALQKAAVPLQDSIREEANRVMPSSGGYRAVFSKSLKFRVSRRSSGRSASLRLLTFAGGLKERRDITALERGMLRHPVFGRSRRLKVGNRAGNSIANPWSVTEIRPGFHKRGTDDAGDEVEKRIIEVLEEYASRLTE